MSIKYRWLVTQIATYYYVCRYIRKVQGVPYGLRRFYFVDRCFLFAQIYFRIIYIFDAYWLDYYIGKADQKWGYENFERNFLKVASILKCLKKRLFLVFCFLKYGAIRTV